MVSTDPIADMLSRIRNAIAVNKNAVSLPYSIQKETVAAILVKNGFLKDVKSGTENGYKMLNIVINDEQTSSNITQIKRLSRPGRREYVKAKEIPVLKRGRGLVIVSTSRGVMTGEDAKNQKLGGELICQVY
ncbi:30S ribosomal protein S8 [Candidatus Saccharibacteria bacterium]|nr:30S ribosomal protein S8 [Candidatus Saccharibacteria bacterium]